MRKADVKIGGTYWAKVNRRPARVQVIAEHERGGWCVLNRQTGRKLRLRTSARLIAPVEGQQDARLGQSVTEPAMPNLPATKP